MIWREVLGEENPVGTPTEISDVPTAAGSNAVFYMIWFPVKTTGFVVIVPTPGPPVWSVAVTGTLTVRPPRTAWVPSEFRVVALSRTEKIWMVVLPLVVVVEKFPGGGG